MALTWFGLVDSTRGTNEEEESMESMRALLQAMTSAARAKDAALRDMERRLKAALDEAEQGRAREAALLRRAEKSEEAEEALASQMAELEAEAFTRITEANKLLAAGAAATHMQPVTTSLSSTQVEKLERSLQAALEEAAALAARCKGLEEELEQARVRGAAFRRQAEKAEEVEQMGELQAGAFSDPAAEEVERRLAEVEEELEAVQTKLRQAEERSEWLEMRLGKEEGMQKGREGEHTLVSVSLQDMAGLVKLKLWNPASLTLTAPN